jgi:hypothetical protein
MRQLATLAVVVVLAWMSPTAASGDWRRSQYVYVATRQHIEFQNSTGRERCQQWTLLDIALMGGWLQ